MLRVKWYKLRYLRIFFAFGFGAKTGTQPCAQSGRVRGVSIKEKRSKEGKKENMLFFLFPGFISSATLLRSSFLLILSFIEIQQSTKALELELSDIEELGRANIFTDMFYHKEESKGEGGKVGP